MAEQLRVVGRDQQRRAVKDQAEFVELFDARAQEMAGMFVGRAQGGRAVVKLFFPRPAGDAMVFDPGETARLGRGKIRS